MKSEILKITVQPTSTAKLAQAVYAQELEKAARAALPIGMEVTRQSANPHAMGGEWETLIEWGGGVSQSAIGTIIYEHIIKPLLNKFRNQITTEFEYKDCKFHIPGDEEQLKAIFSNETTETTSETIDGKENEADKHS
jgi:hypothetical protein